MGNVVLVHGGWGGGWCWERVAPGLRDRGHTVLTPDLHRGSLAADTAAVQEAVDGYGGPTVVCGWSYGGAVITGLELGPASHLVYLTAFVPDANESCASAIATAPSLLGSAIRPQDDGTAVIDPTLVDAALWADAPADVAAAARQRLVPQAVAGFTESPARQAWKTVPSTYVLCTQDQAITPDLQRRMAERCREVVEWDCSHSPMLSRPADVVALLDKLAS